MGLIFSTHTVAHTRARRCACGAERIENGKPSDAGVFSISGLHPKHAKIMLDVVAIEELDTEQPRTGAYL